MKKILLLILFWLSFYCKQAYSQSESPILSMDVATISVANNFIDSLPVETDSTVYSVVVNVNLFDTVDVQNIEVKIGTTAGGSDLVNQTFAFDVSGSLSGGMSYLRELYRVQLGVGNLIGLGDYYAEVRVQRLDGSYSPSVVFNR